MIKALIVDDEKAIRDCLARILRAEDIEVKTAGSGENAIELCRRESFDLIFLDMIMSGINGIETHAVLKTIQGNTRYVIVSGSPAGSFLEAATRENIGIIRKPFDIDEIMAEVEKSRQAKTGG